MGWSYLLDSKPVKIRDGDSIIHPPISKFDLGLHDGVPGVARTLWDETHGSGGTLWELLIILRKNPVRENYAFCMIHFFLFFVQELCPRCDKVSTLTIRLKWPSEITRPTTHFTWGLIVNISDLQTSKMNMVIHDTNYPCWDHVTLSSTQLKLKFTVQELRSIVEWPCENVVCFVIWSTMKHCTLMDYCNIVTVFTRWSVKCTEPQKNSTNLTLKVLSLWKFT